MGKNTQKANFYEKIKFKKTLHSLGLLRFASAMMWVLQEVFYLESEKMICCPNEKEGRFFLDEIMTGGNFGQYGNDDVMRQHGRGNVAFFMARMKRNVRFFKHYPSLLTFQYIFREHTVIILD